MKSRILLLYGLAIYASGLIRFLFFPGGANGLWFGLVMGTLALLGSWLLSKGKILPGLVLAVLSIAFTGGWYTWECFMIKGVADAEWRQLIMIMVSVVVALLLVTRGRKKE